MVAKPAITQLPDVSLAFSRRLKVVDSFSGTMNYARHRWAIIDQTDPIVSDNTIIINTSADAAEIIIELPG